MKYIKVTVVRETEPGRPAMRYPAIFNAQAVHRAGGTRMVNDQGLSRGLAQEEIVYRVENTLADTYDLEPGVEIMSDIEVDAWLLTVPRIMAQPEERVTDSDRIQVIIAKNGASIALSAEDLKAMDPDDPIRGITRVPKTAAGIFDAP